MTRGIAMGFAAAALLAAQAANAEDALPLLTLDEALAGAKQNSPDLAVLHEKVAQAATIVDKAWVLYRPQASAGITFQRNNAEQKLDMGLFVQGMAGIFGATVPAEKLPPPTVIQHLNQWSGQFVVYQPIVNARALPQIENAKAAGELASLSVEQARREILFGVAASYFAVAGLQQGEDLTRRTVEQFAGHERGARSRLAQGTTPRVAVLRAEIDRRRAEEDLVRARYGLQGARRSLGIMVGRADTFRVEAPEAQVAEPEDEAVLVARALGSRPDVKAARAQIEVAKRTLTDVWYKLIPTLGAQFVLRYSDSAGFSDTNWPWFAGLNLSVPLYDGGLRYAEAREAESKIREAQAQLRSVTNRVTDDVARARLELLAAVANLEKARALVQLAKESAAVVKAAWDSGLASYVETSDAATQLAMAEGSVLVEAVGVRVAALKVARAVGDFRP